MSDCFRVLWHEHPAHGRLNEVRGRGARAADQASAPEVVAGGSGSGREMNIGIFTPTYPGLTGEGGIGTYTRNLAHALCRLGHRVHVLCEGPRRDSMPENGVTVHLTPAQHLPLVERVVPGAGPNYHLGQAMRRLVREQRLDLVEFPNWGGWGLWYQARRAAPMVVRLHTSAAETQGIDGAEPSSEARWDVRRERWMGRWADCLVTHSQAHRQKMAEELAVSPERIAVVAHGIPVHPEFQRPQRNGGAELTVVYLGRLEKRKGTPQLLEAIPQVLRRVPQARFVLIGLDRAHCPGGRTHAQYIEQELPPEARQRIRLMGMLPAAEVDRWLQSAELFVAPSLYESFGLIFLEAMRWGTPVIGTRAGAIPEIITDSQSGRLVGAGQVVELAEAMVQLLGDEALRRRLGEAGRQRVERQFAIDRVAAEVAALYEQTIGECQER